jgi:hypothetical protein
VGIKRRRRRQCMQQFFVEHLQQCAEGLNDVIE